MANKRYVKMQKIVKATLALPSREERIADWSKRQEQRDTVAQNEYRYCLAEAKRQHPDWTLAQRQAYARNAASSLFD